MAPASPLPLISVFDQTAESFRHIGVIGAGAWGTALAQIAAATGREVLIRCRDAHRAGTINSHHTNADYLPNVALDPAIRATTDPLAITDWADVIMLATPAQAAHKTATALAPNNQRRQSLWSNR